MGRKKANHEIECLHCGSTNLIKKGCAPKYNWQLFRCKDCGCYSNDKAIEVGAFLSDIAMECPDCKNTDFTIVYDRLTRFDIICKQCNATYRYDWDDYVDDMNSSDPTEEQPKPERTTTTGIVDNSESDFVALDSSPIKPHTCSCKRCSEPEITKVKLDSELVATESITDPDLRFENTRLQKKVLYRDKINRVERKGWRKYTDADLTTEIIEKSIIDILESRNKDLLSSIGSIKKIENTNTDCSGLIHLSDLHFNEIVEGVIGNHYNFEVASRRLKLYVDNAKKIMKTYGVTDVYVLLTGDLVNNDKISDKRLNQVYNRSYATVIGADLLSRVIIDLAQDFRVKVTSVTGNESRVNDVDGVGYSTKIITDNFDWIIHNFLAAYLKGVENVEIRDGRFDEKIVTIMNTNVLMIHGNNIPTTDNHKAIQNTIGKWSASGYRVDFVIYGHIHSCNLGDLHARSSSLVGSNNYSFNGLQIYGRASQNLHLIFRDGNRHSIKIDLQNIEGVVGYPLKSNLMDDIRSISASREDIIVVF